MRIKAYGTTFLASGTVNARVVLPKGMNLDLDIFHVLPDVLVFDGEVPDEDDKAFGHIRPEDWLDSVSESVPSEGDVGSSFSVVANIVEVPLKVLPGRQREFSNFVSKVLFKTNGAIAGIMGLASVAVHVPGLPMDGEAGAMELSGLPFQGSVRLSPTSMKRGRTLSVIAVFSMERPYGPHDVHSSITALYMDRVFKNPRSLRYALEMMCIVELMELLSIFSRIKADRRMLRRDSTPNATACATTEDGDSPRRSYSVGTTAIHRGSGSPSSIRKHCDYRSQHTRVRSRIIRRYVVACSRNRLGITRVVVVGIPFAEPPVGQLRLSNPVLKTRLGTPTFDASNFGPACLQSVSWLSAAVLLLKLSAWPTRIPQGVEAQKRGALNLGLKDQLAALEWVQANIGLFGSFHVGGDKSKVSTHVENLLMETNNRCRPALADDQSGELFAWDPTIDGPGGILPDIPSKLLARGQFARLPFIAGTVLDEGTTFTPKFITTEDQIRQSIIANFTPSPFGPAVLAKSAETILQLYPDVPALGSPFGTGNETFGLSSQYKRAAAICSYQITRFVLT
ncbi:feruloyl esterase [Salix suchowensis]|nr:feruloyl esterase [Salix suchowensis]